MRNRCAPLFYGSCCIYLLRYTIIPASHSQRRCRSKNIIRYINRTTIRSIIYFIIIYKIVLHNYARISIAAASRTAGVGNNNIIIVDITVHYNRRPTTRWRSLFFLSLQITIIIDRRLIDPNDHNIVPKWPKIALCVCVHHII